MNEKSTYLLSLIGYYVLVVIAIMLSSYLTYQGFVRSVPGLAVPIAAVVGLVLFVVDIAIQRYRENGKSIVVPLIVFAIPAMISGASNFNTVYTAFMQGDVSRSALAEQYAIYRDDLVATRTTLSQDPRVAPEIEEREEIAALLQNLWSQCTDIGRPGCGNRALTIVDEINGKLERRVTDLAFPGPGSSPEEVKPVFDNFEVLVYQNKDSEADAAAFVKYRDLATYINDSLFMYEDIDFDVDIEKAREWLRDMAVRSENVEDRANALLPASDNVAHVELDPEAGRLGEIIYTIQNGLFEVPNLSATIFSLFIALFVDFMPIIVAFVVNYKDIRPEFAEEEDSYDMI